MNDMSYHVYQNRMYQCLALIHQQMFQTPLVPKVSASEKELKTDGTYLMLNEKGVQPPKNDSLND